MYTCHVFYLGEKQREKEKLERHGSISSTASNKSTGTSSSSAAGSSPPTKHDETWVHEIFEGTLTNETRCLSCETVSTVEWRVNLSTPAHHTVQSDGKEQEEKGSKNNLTK